jgi:ribose 5-phosphate isomerase A
VNDSLKHSAAAAALDELKTGMVIGLGSGSTMAYFIRGLGERVRRGLSVSTVATSLQSASLAAEEGIPVRTFREHKALDLTVDGADEVSPRLDLVKGLGGALVREKIVAKASRRLIIVVDETKLVDRLGSRVPVPVEVLPFARDLVEYTLAGIGGEPRVRLVDGVVFESDNGNHILDWHVEPIEDPGGLEKDLKSITGVVYSGIFANLADRVIVAGAGGIRTMDRPGQKGETAE